MKLDLMSEIQTGSLAAGAAKPVDRPAGQPVGTGKTASKSTASTASTAATGSVAGGVTVTLSAQSQSLTGVGASTDTFDAGKVEAMKASIANGSFQVNAKAIADKLLTNASEMLSASRR
jgi:negative regulator of flagellin synthesis FlgM